MSEKSKPIHKYTGIALIIMGAVLIIIAAITAYISFHGYKLPEITSGSVDMAIISLVRTLADIAIRLGFLGIMVWAGSIFLRYGIQSIK
ncbi:MAG: hypothetical protein QW551_04410 [Desulfurococcaceae archaeon]